MADLSDIGIWLEERCAAVCYPNGTGADPITGSGKKITIGRGWPDPKSLDAAMAAGNAFVSIYPMSGMERNTSRFPKQWQAKAVPAAQTVVTTTVNTVTISGTPTVGEAVVVIVGTAPYGYKILTGDTPTIIAAALAALIPAATSSGPVLTIHGVTPLASAAISVTGTAIKETRRQQRVFAVYVWAPDPATRDFIVQALDNYFSDIERFVVASDQTWAKFTYHGTNEIDELQVRNIYKRWLMYAVEYATTQTQTTQTTMATSIGFSSSH